MAAPNLIAQIQGQGSVSADNLNTFEQTCDSVAQLRAFVGLPGMQVYARGVYTPNDGGAGPFYWDAEASGPDNNATVIVPTGTASGAWIKIQVANKHSPFYFGAAGNGIADDTAAVQAAINTGTLYVDPGAIFLCGRLSFIGSLSIFLYGELLASATLRGQLDGTYTEWMAFTVSNSQTFYLGGGGQINQGFGAPAAPSYFPGFVGTTWDSGTGTMVTNWNYGCVKVAGSGSVIIESHQLLNFVRGVFVEGTSALAPIQIATVTGAWANGNTSAASDGYWFWNCTDVDFQAEWLTSSSWVNYNSSTFPITGGKGFGSQRCTRVRVKASKSHGFQWVAFGAGNVNALTVSSLTNTGGTATCTTNTNHLYESGLYVYFYGVNQSAYNAQRLGPITVTGATTFTFPIAGSPTSPATAWAVSGAITVIEMGEAAQFDGIFANQPPADTTHINWLTASINNCNIRQSGDVGISFSQNDTSEAKGNIVNGTSVAGISVLDTLRQIIVGNTITDIAQGYNSAGGWPHQPNSSIAHGVASNIDGMTMIPQQLVIDDLNIGFQNYPSPSTNLGVPISLFLTTNTTGSPAAKVNTPGVVDNIHVGTPIGVTTFNCVFPAAVCTTASTSGTGTSGEVITGGTSSVSARFCAYAGGDFWYSEIIPSGGTSKFTNGETVTGTTSGATWVIHNPAGCTYTGLKVGPNIIDYQRTTAAIAIT